MAWLLKNELQELNAYDNLAQAFTNLREYERAKYYHQLTMQGNTFREDSKVREVYRKNSERRKRERASSNLQHVFQKLSRNIAFQDMQKRSKFSRVLNKTIVSKLKLDAPHNQTLESNINILKFRPGTPLSEANNSDYLPSPRSYMKTFAISEPPVIKSSHELTTREKTKLLISKKHCKYELSRQLSEKTVDIAELLKSKTHIKLKAPTFHGNTKLRKVISVKDLKMPTTLELLRKAQKLKKPKLAHNPCNKTSVLSNFYNNSSLNIFNKRKMGKITLLIG